MNLKQLTVCILIAGLAGCSSLSGEGGVFEDRAMDYKEAHSIDRVLTAEDTGGQYARDDLYPVPLPTAGKLFEETPRVSSSYISLELNAILLHKNESFDRTLFANIYGQHLELAIESFARERQFQAGEADLTSLQKKLVETGDVQGQVERQWVTQWTSGKALGYPQPGFWKRLFGADKLQHQYAFFLSKPKLTAQDNGLDQYTTQLHIAHRTRTGKGKPVSQWTTTVDADEFIGTELIKLVDHLKQQVAMASAGKLNSMTITSEKDGNGLPYLAISDRFALVWEALLKVIPQKTWKVTDLDRSKGMIYVELSDKKTVQALGLDHFQLQLSEGPQMMILSVDKGDDQPADAANAERILAVIYDGFSRLIEVNSND